MCVSVKVITFEFGVWHSNNSALVSSWSITISYL